MLFQLNQPAWQKQKTTTVSQKIKQQRDGAEMVAQEKEALSVAAGAVADMVPGAVDQAEVMEEDSPTIVIKWSVVLGHY